ncbi:MAG: 3-isopropylmalate dehydratase [Fusobacteria bacterium]|nr:MAG: 3-isopropylmalate dehydratase [Fusobacteriota bacterium]
MSKITGKVYVLGDNIDTDQIIPAMHLIYKVNDEEESKEYGRFALSGLPTEIKEKQPFVKEGKYVSDYKIIVAGKNFGCGSSREHAPLALEKAGIEAIIAKDYARIFYRNSVDGGFLIPYESEVSLVDAFSTGDDVEVEGDKIKNLTTGKEYVLKPLGDVKEIIDAGGLFSFARKKGLIS